MPTRHTIAEGETLAEIAERYHTTVQVLVELNNIVDPNRIPAGLVLQLPTPTPTPAP
jgi:LysM repeat protein